MKQSLFLLKELIRRDLTSRFAGSFGGPVWALVNPLLFCLLYGFVFSVILKIPAPEGFPGRYVEFLLAGLLPWLGLQEAVLRGSSAVTEQSHLVKKLRFPFELLVASSLGTALLLETAGVALLLAYSALAGRASARLPLLGAAFVFEALLLVGPVLFLATLNVFFRDLPQLLSPALMVVFYLTPILYPESLVPAAFARVLSLNPVRDMSSLFRAGLYGTAAPPMTRLLLWSSLSLVLAFAGHRFFRRCERSFADLL